jgi:hypothetical protein
MGRVKRSDRSRKKGNEMRKQFWKKDKKEKQKEQLKENEVDNTNHLGIRATAPH